MSEPQNQTEAACGGSAMTAELERTQRLLERAIERMDRARMILTDGNPRPECNWGMLDTSDLRSNVKLTGGAPGIDNEEPLPERRPVERFVGGDVS